MPELPVKEGRLPELHLPEIDRDQIISSLSGLRLPAVDITTIERPRFGRRARPMQSRLKSIDWRSIDLGPAVAGVAVLGRLGGRARPLVRTRWAVAAGVVVIAGVATAALIATPAVRERAGRTIRDVRARMDAGASADRLEVDADITDTEADVETVAEDVVAAAAETKATVADAAHEVITAG
jgi:hypothetical protein